MANKKQNYNTIPYKWNISVDKFGDMCIKDIDCLIALCPKMALFSHIIKYKL